MNTPFLDTLQKQRDELRARGFTGKIVITLEKPDSIRLAKEIYSLGVLDYPRHSLAVVYQDNRSYGRILLDSDYIVRWEGWINQISELAGFVDFNKFPESGIIAIETSNDNGLVVDVSQLNK